MNKTKMLVACCLAIAVSVASWAVQAGTRAPTTARLPAGAEVLEDNDNLEGIQGRNGAVVPATAGVQHFKTVPLREATVSGIGLALDRTDDGDDLTPIPDAWLQAFREIRPDPHPDKLTRNSHYWISDEKRHDVFREDIENSGGIFVGLGTDQNYLMAAWAKPQVLIPLDFDQMIIYLHFAFRAVFLKARTAKEFERMWSPEAESETLSLISSEYRDADEDFLKGILRAFKKGRKHVAVRLKRIRRIYGRLKLKTFLTDPEQYAYIVRLFQTDRVFPVRGDLTAERTLRDVAKAARQVGLPVRTLYLSNAEQYFKFTPDYKENMRGLPFDEKSRVIRTVGKRTNASPDGFYEYIVQNGHNFSAWLDYPKLYTVWTLFRARNPRKGVGSTQITKLPPKEN